MIPRTKANYTLVDLFRASFIREAAARQKERLVATLASYTGCGNVLLMPSGRAGLYYLLRSLPHARVVLPAYTCKAVAEAAMLAGKELVYVEAEPDGFNMDLSALTAVLDDRSVLIATHQFGIPCAIEEMVALAAERGAIVIEDAAASFGSRVGGKLTGTFGDAAFFSFDSTKLVNVPMKGGFVIIKSPDLFRRVAADYQRTILTAPFSRRWALLLQAVALVLIENPVLYRAFHWIMFESRGTFTQDNDVLDRTPNAFYQYDMSEWQAFIAAEQLSRIDSLIERRRELYRYYRRSLTGLECVNLAPEDVGSEWACVRFPIRIRGDKIAYYRRAAERGVDFAFSFTYLAAPRTFRRAWDIADSVLDLPFYPKLSASEQERVVRVLRELETEGASHERA